MVVAQWSHPITGYRGSRPSIDNFSTTLISCKLLKDKNKEKEVGNGPLKNTKNRCKKITCMKAFWKERNLLSFIVEVKTVMDRT